MVWLPATTSCQRMVYETLSAKKKRYYNEINPLQISTPIKTLIKEQDNDTITIFKIIWSQVPKTK